jgi:hypothetical protein
MGGLESIHLNNFERPLWGNSLLRRIFTAVTASVNFDFLHLHPLRQQRAGLSATRAFVQIAANGSFPPLVPKCAWCSISRRLGSPEPLRQRVSISELRACTHFLHRAWGTAVHMIRCLMQLSGAVGVRFDCQPLPVLRDTFPRDIGTRDTAGQRGYKSGILSKDVSRTGWNGPVSERQAT